MTRLTAKALMYLVLVPANTTLPLHTPLRRAAIDLIGRGFTLWEPHLEVSKVLLGLLDMSSEAAMWVPSQKYGLPLTPGVGFRFISSVCLFNFCKTKLTKEDMILVMQNDMA